MISTRLKLQSMNNHLYYDDVVIRNIELHNYLDEHYFTHTYIYNLDMVYRAKPSIWNNGVLLDLLGLEREEENIVTFDKDMLYLMIDTVLDHDTFQMYMDNPHEFITIIEDGILSNYYGSIYPIEWKEEYTQTFMCYLHQFKLFLSKLLNYTLDYTMNLNTTSRRIGYSGTFEVTEIQLEDKLNYMVVNKYLYKGDVTL